MIRIHSTKKLLANCPSMSMAELSRSALAPLVIDSQCDRSVQGTMTQMAQDLAHSLWYNNAKVTDLLPYSTSLWLADRPCRAKGVKGWIWPIEAMFALLDKAP